MPTVGRCPRSNPHIVLFPANTNRFLIRFRCRCNNPFSLISSCPRTFPIVLRNDSAQVLLKPPKNPVNFPALGKSALKQVGQPIPTGGDHPDDTALLAQVVRGSEDALVALHRRYVNLVFSLSLRMLGDPMATEEVTQDVFIKLWQNPHAYDPKKGRFSSWLLTVTRHAAIDRLRQECRQPSRVSISQEKDPYSTLEHMNPKDNPYPEAHQALRIALEQLPLDQRTVIDLAYFGGMSQQDIAESLRLPLGTVKTRIRLGMQHLRAMWNHHP